MAKLPTIDDMAKDLAERAMQEITVNGMTLREFIGNLENDIAHNECHVASCRYNDINCKCTNEEKRKECVDVSKLVLCLDGDKCEKKTLTAST